MFTSSHLISTLYKMEILSFTILSHWGGYNYIRLYIITEDVLIHRISECCVIISRMSIVNISLTICLVWWCEQLSQCCQAKPNLCIDQGLAHCESQGFQVKSTEIYMQNHYINEIYQPIIIWKIIRPLIRNNGKELKTLFSWKIYAWIYCNP